ncbi:MAG: hypothetical protein EBR30_06270 [Cytophagia bacterium]|jgi:hypothetical protein|nr:hypothetical protein [Cytophagia bacterium]
MEPIQPIDNSNLRPIIGKNPINIPNANINRISGPSVISTIDKPTIRGVETPVIRGLEVPVVDVPNTAIKYPVINVPTQAEFDAAVKAEREKQAAEQQQEKSRGLPDAKPPDIPPAVQQITQQPPAPTPVAEIPADKPQPTFSVYGVNVNLPDPSVVATAGAVAVVTTATTMISGIALNALKNAAEPLIREAAKNKFKIKLKQVKPVLHYVLAEEGHIDIFEYSSEGTRLVEQVDNVEQYIRDQVDTNALYEVENKIIIDDVISDKFTKEGQKRFKSLFAPAKKVAKKLSARLSF